MTLNGKVAAAKMLPNNILCAEIWLANDLLRRIA